jgi:hypothetical protein
MNIMLDNSVNRLIEREEKYGRDFMQLQTPISRRGIVRPYGLDNGCFARFLEGTWKRQVKLARGMYSINPDQVKFVTLPDVVGDARRTLELFEYFKPMTRNVPRALVLQDGIGQFAIPWKDIDAVFVGGTDQFKYSPECVNACIAAQHMGKWVHIGRVNGAGRAAVWVGKCNSIDGSGISQYDEQLEVVLHAINNTTLQGSLL